VAVQPPWFAVIGQSVKAPGGGRFVETLVRPLHDDEHTAGLQCRLDMVEHIVQVSDVVQRSAGHDRMNRGRWLVLFEGAALIGPPLGRFRVDAQGLVSGRLKCRNETSESAAPDLTEAGAGGRCSAMKGHVASSHRVVAAGAVASVVFGVLLRYAADFARAVHWVLQ
jgi:hypothetical protein